MSRGTSKPCPGCKEENTGRPTDGVCIQCERRLAAAIAQENMDAESQGEKLYSIPWFWPHISVSAGSYELANDIQKTFIDLMRAAGRVDPRGEDNRHYWHMPESESIFEKPERISESNGKKGVVWLKPAAAVALAELHELILLAIKTAEQKGYERGQDLIGGLAAGDLSLAQLNRATITGKRSDT